MQRNSGSQEGVFCAPQQKINPGSLDQQRGDVLRSDNLAEKGRGDLF